MAERLKAAVLKTVELRGSVGSNPTSSAMEMTQVGKPACLFIPAGWLRRIRTDEVETRQENVPVARFQRFARPSLRGRGRPLPQAKPESRYPLQRELRPGRIPGSFLRRRPQLFLIRSPLLFISPLLKWTHHDFAVQNIPFRP